MVIPDDFHLSIHVTLKRLIEEKSKRDNIKFTASQLAHALDMPRSIITKLTHSDRSKRVINPRIDTIIKIVDFFRTDGFDITIEDLIGFKDSTIDIADQSIHSSEESISIPIYTLENKKNQSIGLIDVKVVTKNKNLFGLYTNCDIEPFFKTGSIFVIDPDAPLENDNLIAIKIPHENNIEIRKYFLEENKVILKSLDPSKNNIILMPTMQCEILGVVLQVNAKT